MYEYIDFVNFIKIMIRVPRKKTYPYLDHGFVYKFRVDP